MASRLLVLLIAVVLAGCAVTRYPSPKFVLADTGELARLKSESEQWGHRIKIDYKKGSTQYETAYSKYIPAKAGTDKWLDRLGLDLTAHSNIASSGEYQAALRDASAKAADFISYARSLYEESLSTSPIVDILNALTKSGLEIWDKYRAASKEVVEDVKKNLQSLKWKSFDEI